MNRDHWISGTGSNSELKEVWDGSRFSECPGFGTQPQSGCCHADVNAVVPLWEKKKSESLLKEMECTLYSVKNVERRKTIKPCLCKVSPGILP